VKVYSKFYCCLWYCK